MADNDTNNTYPSFSARLDERLSDLSNSLVGPGHLFQSNSQLSQPWQGATPYTPGGGGGGGYHNDTSQPHSYLTYDGQQDAPANNENQARSDELSSELELLHKKRAEALASISQKRAASRGENPGKSDVARGGSGTQASMAQGSNSASNQPQRAKRSAVDENVESQSKEESQAGRAGVVEHQKSHPRQVASAEDIDGLLAEGRVSAAANASKSPAKAQLSGEYVSTRRRASFLSGENNSPAANVNAHRHHNSQEPSPKLGSDGQKVSHTPAVSETVGSSVADNIEVTPHMDMKSMSGQYSRSDHKSYPEQRVYEPPRHPMADNKPKPRGNEPPRRLPTRSVYRSNGSPPTSDCTSDRHPPSAILASWETDNEFSKLQSNEVEELREWLEYTGYYDENYRRGKLHRFKRLTALEREREELMREELQEREALTKSRDRAPYSIGRSYSFDSLSHDPQASPSMPPPSFIPRINTSSITTKHADTQRELNSGVSDDHISNQASPSNPSKRQFSDFENGAQPERVEKMVRTQYNSNPKEVLHSEEAPDFMNKERMHMIKDHKLPYGDNSSVLGGGDRKFTDQASSNWEQNTDPFIQNSPQRPDEGQVDSYGGRGGSVLWRGRGRGRGRSRGLVRGRGRGRRGSSAASTRGVYSSSGPKGSEELGLVAGDISYFLIKCVAYDMVNAAKIEGTWATQEKNVERLAAAFDKSRHVVLVFSVNQSGAFQGYARMDTRPGDPGVATPSWFKKPGLPLGPPFRITWYNKVETMFKYVGHLKNPYNENHDVTYARDGQELEADCGRVLCGLLDKSLDFVSPSA